MPRRRIPLYSPETGNWRQAFDEVVKLLLEAEGRRIGKPHRVIESTKNLRVGENLAVTEDGLHLYWQAYLALSTSSESGIRRRFNDMRQLPERFAADVPRRVVFALARDLPRDCEQAALLTADSLGRHDVMLDIWEPKDIRRRIAREFGISCPALQYHHLLQLLQRLWAHTTPPKVASQTADGDPERLGTLFVSYASEDREFVDKLVDALNPFAHQVWYDRQQILVGEDFVSSINAGLDEADFVVAVISSASVQKPWVRNEIFSTYARQTCEGKVRLLPVVIEYCKLPSILSSIRYADFTRHFSIGLNDLLLAIKGIRAQRRDDG